MHSPVSLPTIPVDVLLSCTPVDVLCRVLLCACTDLPQKVTKKICVVAENLLSSPKICYRGAVACFCFLEVSYQVYHIAPLYPLYSVT